MRHASSSLSSIAGSRVSIVASFVAMGLTSSAVLAIDGPGSNAISVANWGSAGNDLFPYAGRVEVDINNNGRWTEVGFEDTHGTGTLIAPNVMVTAGHVLSDIMGANAAVPNGRVRVNFGSLGIVPVMGGRTRGITAQAANDFAFLTLGAPAPTQPVALLPRMPKVGDVNFAVGYGIALGNNLAPANNPRRPIIDPLDDFYRHANGVKNWGSITVDAVNVNFVEQTIQTPERWTETGDSGGPGLQFYSGAFPSRAYNANINSSFKFRDYYAMSAVSGGPTPVTNDSTTAANITYPAAAAGNDQWTRLDNQGSFFNGAANGPASLRPTVEIFHNLPNGFIGANPADKVKVLFTGRFPAGSSYLFNLRLREEDNSGADQPFGFDGDPMLGAQAAPGTRDDLVGYGHSAGVLGAGQTTVYAWDETTVADLLQMADDLTGIDFKFNVNYADDVNTTIFPLGLNGIDAAINLFANDPTAVRVGFAMVPEPASMSACAGVMTLMLRRKRAG